MCSSIALAQRTPPVLKGAGSTAGTNSPIVSAPRPSSGDDVVRIETNLITVPAVVMDRDGRYIPNLRSADFKLFEDGVEQKLAYFAPVEKPFTVILMLDMSGSTQTQLAQIRVAANTLIGRLRPNDQLMAMTFDGQIHVLCEPTLISVVRRTKLHIPAVTDGTVLYDAVDTAMKRVAGISGRKAIILFTDGVDQNSSHATLKDNLTEATELDVMIYTVRYNTLPQLSQRLSVIKKEKARRKVEQEMMKKYAVSESYLRSLSDKTGGRFYRADDLKDVAPAFEAITQELGVQYSLGYYPKMNSASGSQRNIKVKVRFQNMVVRARDSYSTSIAVARQGGAQ